MILFVSGRTDIVAFYTEWFMKKIEEGFVMVRNPFNPKLVSKIDFNNVDMIMFCTKNPLPIIPYLNKINKPILFHVTLTPYKKDIEPNVIDKTKIIEGIKEISQIIGINNIVVRYDPIFLSDKYICRNQPEKVESLSQAVSYQFTHFPRFSMWPYSVPAFAVNRIVV